METDQPNRKRWDAKDVGSRVTLGKQKVAYSNPRTNQAAAAHSREISALYNRDKRKSLIHEGASTTQGLGDGWTESLMVGDWQQEVKSDLLQTAGDQVLP
jgi:hypothetical protein